MQGEERRVGVVGQSVDTTDACPCAPSPAHPDLLSNNPVARFVDHVIRHHSRELFHVTILLNRHPARRQHESVSDETINIWGKSTGEVVGLVRAKAIDVMVDLAGHTADNRLDVFACSPAPVQVVMMVFIN